MNGTCAVGGLRVTADGTGLASHAGSLLLAEMADRSGLTAGLSAAMAHTRKRASRHDPGTTLAHLAVMLADGGDCMSDLAVLCNQPGLFGAVASDPTAWRTVTGMSVDAFAGIEVARADARARVWAAGAAPATVTLDFDATLLTAYSEKQDAAANYKRGFGFQPLLCTLDETGEALAGINRPGNAGANDSADHLTVLDAALAQLPVTPGAGVPMLARADSAGATHAFVDALRAHRVRFSVGFDLTAPVRAAVLALAAEAWVPARDADGQDRDGAQVAELVGLNLTSWPAGTRAIVRRERPHPGAQLTFTDVDGHRFQSFITDQDDTDLAALEPRQRGHARVEDRIRAARATGLRNLPFGGYTANEAWLQLVLMAMDLTAWTQHLCLEGSLAVAEPKKLRYRLFHTAARLATTGRITTVRLDRNWPWAAALAAAFKRLRAALPA